MGIEKRAYDTRLFDVSVANAIRDGDTLHSVDGVVVLEKRDSASDIMVDDISHTAAVVRFSVSGGDAGEDYVLGIRFTTDTTPQQVIESRIRLSVLQDDYI